MDDFRHLDDYAVLGVSPGALPEAIKQAYRREITKYHPDRFRNADPEMQQYAQARSQRITEAYASLNRNPRARSQPRRVAPVTSAEQLAADYQQAQTLLATGAAGEAARLLRQIQRVDPFYRDVDDLLARAETLNAGAAGGHPLRRPAAWLTGGLIALLLLGGGAYGWSALQSPQQAQQPPTGTAGAIVGQNPTGVAAETATSTPLVVVDAPTGAGVEPSAPAATGIAGGAPTTPEVAPTTPPPPTETLPSPTAVPPTEAPPSPTAVPPTEAPPSPTAVPPTEIPPTQAPPPPTEVPPTRVPPTAVPRPTQRPAPTPVPPTQAPPPPQRVSGVESGQVLVAENFGNPGSGWPSLQQPNYTLGYRDGAYVITSQPNTGAIFAYGSPLGQSNAIIGADVIPVRGSAGLNFGPDNSYRFLINANGQFRVEQRGRVIVRPAASNAIRAGRNRLVLAVVGTRASVYANGVLLANLNVPAPLAGSTYGFVVVPGPNGGEAIFDSLTVRTLPR